VKAAQQRRTPKRGREFNAHDALAFWSAPVLRRFWSTLGFAQEYVYG
jgi:hypothetical protein